MSDRLNTGRAYLSKMLTVGCNTAEIRVAMLAAGWGTHEIDSLVAEHEGPPEPEPGKKRRTGRGIRLEDVERRADEARRAVEEVRATLVTPEYGVSLGQTGAQHLPEEGIPEGQDPSLGIYLCVGADSPPRWAKWARVAGPVDEQTCSLCWLLCGEVFRAGSEELFRYAPPVHRKCRHYLVWYPEKPQDTEDFEVPSAELVARYGHFITRPQEDYWQRVPVVPGYPNSDATWVTDPETGKPTGKLAWHTTPAAPLSREADTALLELLRKPMAIPAEVWKAARRHMAELQHCGYVHIKIAGGTRTVSLSPEGEAAARKAFSAG